MSVNGFSSGRDVSITIYGADGDVLGSSLITELTYSEEANKKRVVALSGDIFNLKFPHGWKGRITLDRKNANLDVYTFLVEQLYYAGNVPFNAIVTETIQEPDGSTTQWTFTNCVFTLTDAGRWKGDDTVTQTFEFESSRRYLIGA